MSRVHEGWHAHAHGCVGMVNGAAQERGACRAVAEVDVGEVGREGDQPFKPAPEDVPVSSALVLVNDRHST